MGIKVETVWQKAGDVYDYRLAGATEARRVLEDFEDEYGIIPNGFVFDGASAPTFLYPWVAPFANLEISARHDLDCREARKKMAESVGWESRGNLELASSWELFALNHRATADARYRKGMIKAKRLSYTWKWRGNVVGSLAWAGVRFGSLIGKGW